MATHPHRQERPRSGWARVLLLLLSVALSTPAYAAVINKILATVDGDPITMYEVQQFEKKDIRARQAAGTSRSELLEAVITDKIVEREVSEKGIIVRDEDVTAYIESIKQRNHLNDEQLAQALQAQGLTMEQYRIQIREDLQRQQLIAREIRGKVSVSPEEIERYYQAHIDEYSTPSRIELSHIVFRLAPDAPSDQVAAITAKAEEVREKIEDGESFEDAAKQYSEDASAAEGGKLGWFKKGELLEPMELAAAKLKVGEVSQPVRTKTGLHLIKLDAREGEGKTDLAELQEQIKQQLYQKAIEERFKTWMGDDLRARHQVELLQ